MVAEPILAGPGQPERFDSEYTRNGTANLFMVSKPLLGWRTVTVTEPRTSVNFAEVVLWLAEEVHETDNLNTHKLALLYEAFPPDHRAAGDPPYAQALQLTENGREHAVGACQAVPGPAARIDGIVAAGSVGVGGATERAGRRGAVAVHHGRCTDQTPPALPSNLSLDDLRDRG